MGLSPTWLPARLPLPAVLFAVLATVQAGEKDLAELSLKRLMDLDVTSVSKQSQKLGDVATSIYVLEEEEIRRSAATRLQDLLKAVPGAWFSEVSYSLASHAVRGGSLVFKPTILWMLDGVPIGDPVTGTLMFSVLDLPLADIERIEVIKGPGGTIYGANAASGIVSIYTKQGEASDGLHALLDGGTGGYLSPYLRYGCEPRENHFLSAWAKFKQHDGYTRTSLFAGDSLWAPLRGGGRAKVPNRFREEDDDGQTGISGGLKWDVQPSERWRLTGGLSHSRVASPQYGVARIPYPDTPPPGDGSLAKPPDSLFLDEDRGVKTLIQARLDVALGANHAFFLNAHHWRNDVRIMVDKGIDQDYDLTEIEMQDNWSAPRGHSVSGGANLRLIGYRFTDAGSDRSSMFANPEGSSLLAGFFLQDEMRLGPRWALTVGSKAEFASLSGYEAEVSPSLRLAWRPTPSATWWAAASRSITTPSYIQSDMEFRFVQIPPFWVLRSQGFTEPPPAAGKWVSLVPSGDVGPVDYYTLELGHRGGLGDRLQWDLSAFHSWVRGVMALTPVDSTFQTAVPSRVFPGDSVVPMFYGNLIDMEHAGGEALLRIQPSGGVRLELSYALFVNYNYRGLPIPRDTAGRTFAAKALDPPETPTHVGRLKAFLDLPWEVEASALGIVSSPFWRGGPFNYVSQRTDDNGGVMVDPSRPQVQLDLVLQRTFFRGRLTGTAWGRNLLADPFVEVHNQYGYTGYPRQIHRSFGIGIGYRY